SREAPPGRERWTDGGQHRCLVGQRGSTWLDLSRGTCLENRDSSARASAHSRWIEPAGGRQERADVLYTVPMSDPFELDDAPLSPAGPQPGARAPEPAYLKALNPPQRQAVEATEGPVLVLAGAGTGKTRVLTTRLAHLLVTGRAWPRQILAVTFTNKAAREMRERVTALIGGVAEGMWLGTFHSLAARILRRHAEVVGLKQNFTILDTDDQIRLLKQLLQAENIDTGRWPARSLLGIIQRWKDRGLTPDKVSAGDAGDFAN